MKILIRGELKEEWVDKEFIIFDKILKESADKTILEAYNHEFDTSLLLYVEDDIDIESNGNSKLEDNNNLEELNKETDDVHVIADSALEEEEKTKEDVNIEMEEFKYDTKKETNQFNTKKPRKRTPKKVNTRCECIMLKDKMANIENVINQMNKELNYWVIFDFDFDYIFHLTNRPLRALTCQGYY